jgi:hypothetical protein
MMTLEDPEDAELAQLATLADGARRILASKGLEPSPAALDLFVDAAPRPLPEPLGHAFGAALGEELVRRLGFRWRAADDGFHVRLVVEGPPTAGSAVVDPFDLVWRRAGGGPSLDDAFRALREALARDPEG